MAYALKTPRQDALDLLMQAAAHSTDCSNGLLLAGTPDQWALLSCYGEMPQLTIESSTVEWLTVALSNSTSIIFSDAQRRDLFSSFIRTQHIDQAFLVGVAIRDKAQHIIGAMLVSSPQAKQPLSAAQHYALETHAAIIGQILQPDSGLLMPTDEPSIERLRLLESVVVNANDAILITEANPTAWPGPRIVYCNPSFLATTGYSLEEVIGQTPRILQCAETNRETLVLIREALLNWQPIEVELINARRDGSRFWVQLSIVPVANEKGWFTHWVAVQRDISERKHAEFLAKQAHADREEKLALESRLLERERIEKELSYAAYHDALTSLHNRAYLMSRLLSIFNEGRNGQIPAVTVLFLDLDSFKFVNDSLGHRAGDDLLTVVARRLETCIRKNDVFARVGGDEFAILLLGENQVSEAIELAQRIVGELSMPVVIEGQDIFTSCSLGIVAADLTHASPEDLLRDADVAMYAAKKQGRGLWALFDASMRKAAIDALLMQSALKQAVAKNEFFVVYQPIYNVMSGEISGVEALVRWLHPELGHIPPDRFISIAEDIGVIHELGGWVMEQGCCELQRWKQAFPALKLHLNVNVSGIELSRPGYAQQIDGILAKTGIAAQELQIEITESVFLQQPDAIAKVLESIRSSGVRVALDDFGTGYSSLGYIDRYPIDAIKIDRSFVSRMMNYARSEAIVRSILSLGRALNIDITAEGVENLPQLQRLKEMQCPFVQGFLLSPPVRAEEMTTLLRAWSA
jgi:diguanylate cyclase (GGDEF)-like protein/PAS domain S-box-containing protein